MPPRATLPSSAAPRPPQRPASPPSRWLAASFQGAEDICIIDLTELSDVCDYFVLATGNNTRMVDAIVDEVEEKVAKAFGEHPFSIEGREERNWILMDYGSVVVHSFTPEAREYYRLEKLWGDAPVIEL